MATYTYSGTFPSSPSTGETMSMNGVTYEYTSKGTWAVVVGTTTVYSVGDGGLSTNDFTNADHTKLDAIETGATADQTKADIEGLGIELPAANLTGTIDAARLDTAATQTAANNSTKIATTAYVETAVAAIVDTAPAALDTLNELAAALGDDADFATTTATSLGEKLPKSGGAMTGAITTNSTFDGRDVATDGTKLDTIETNADVTDATNVAAAGAIMASSVTVEAESNGTPTGGSDGDVVYQYA